MATRSALRTISPVQENSDVAANAAEDNVLVHVRFNPNGSIFSIGEKPASLGDQQWYERLLAGASACYQTLAGGRGFFRIPRSTFDTIPKN